MEFVIYGKPITKKNSQKIILLRRQGKQVPCIVPSDQYKRYERDCALYMPKAELIDTPVNVEAHFYMPTHGRVDLVNLQESLLDILVRYKIIADDCSKIVVSMDGSRVHYDRDKPRTEVSITCVTTL